MSQFVRWGPDYRPETRAWAKACLVAPNTKNMADTDRLVAGLKNAGIWERMDDLYVEASHDEQAGRLSLIRPGLATLVAVNNPGFSQYRGFATDGSSSYLRTGIAVNAYSKFSQNDAHISAFMSLSSGVSTIALGSSGSTGSSRRTTLDPAPGGVIRSQCSTDTAVSTSVASPGGAGFKLVTRSDAINVSFYAGGALVETVASASVSPNTSQLQVFCQGNGASFAIAGRYQRATSIGAGMTAAQVSLFYELLLGYMRAVGAES